MRPLRDYPIGLALCLVSAACQTSFVSIPNDVETLGVPPIPHDLSDPVEVFHNAPSSELVGWFGDGMLLRSRSADASVAFREVTRPGRRGKRLTFDSDPLQRAWMSPSVERPGFLYTRDPDGGELVELVWYDGRKAAATPLALSRGSVSSLRWAASGKQFALATTSPNGLDWTVVVADLDGSRRVLIDGEGVGWAVEDFSADESRLLVSQSRSATRARLLEIDIETGERQPVAGFEVATSVGDARYGASDEILFTADYNADHVGLFVHDRGRRVQSPRIIGGAASIEAIEVSPGRRFIAILKNVAGYGELVIERLSNGERLEIEAIPRGVISTLAFSGDEHLAFSVTTPTRPGDVMSVDLVDGEVTRWTANDEAHRYVEPTLIEFESFDGLSVPAFVYTPPAAPPYPVLVSLHGGPESQARPRFSPSIQSFVRRLGVAVIVPNVRGSTGYGRRYLDLDNAKQREDAVRDVGALLDWVRDEGSFDVDRVALSGGSYGGYLVLASMALYGDRLVAGIDRMGISRFVTFLAGTEDYRRDLRRAEYGDERDPEMYAYLEAISPLHRVGAIDDAMLIVQGANDPRVPRGESEQMVRALVEKGTPVWYILARDEGHGFRKRVNRDYLARATLMFLERYLLGVDRSESQPR